MIKKKTGRAFGLFAAMSLAASGLLLGAPADGAGGVLNNYYCNPNGGWCYQVNGPYSNDVGRKCFWKRSGMNGKPQQLYYKNCPQPWGPDVP